MTRFLFLHFFAVAMAPATFSVAQEAPAGEKRTLTFHRPETKGTKYELSAKASIMRTTDYIAEDERHPAEESVNLEITIEGGLEITNVTPKVGYVNGYTFSVKKVSIVDSSKDLAGIKAGSVIKAKPGKEGRTAFSVDGASPEPLVVEALEAALPQIIYSDEEPDDMMEPAGPVAPGDEWKPDMHRYAKATGKSYRMDLDIEKSTVGTRYKGPVTIAGQKCDAVVSSYDLKFSKRADAAEGWTLKSATMTADTTSSMAHDIKVAAPVSEKSTRESEYRYEIKSDGKEFEAVTKSHDQLHRTMKPVK